MDGDFQRPACCISTTETPAAARAAATAISRPAAPRAGAGQAALQPLRAREWGGRVRRPLHGPGRRAGWKPAHL